MSDESDASTGRKPLDYERRRKRLSTGERIRAISIDVLSALPAFAVPVWAYFVTRHLTNNAARHASMPAFDICLVVLTFAIPIGFALLVCGPLARDNTPRR